MRTTLYLTTLCAALALVASAPAPNPEPNPDPAAQPDPAAAADDRPEIIEIIAPAASAQVPYTYIIYTALRAWMGFL